MAFSKEFLTCSLSKKTSNISAGIRSFISWKYRSIAADLPRSSSSEKVKDCIIRKLDFSKTIKPFTLGIAGIFTGTPSARLFDCVHAFNKLVFTAFIETNDPIAVALFLWGFHI